MVSLITTSNAHTLIFPAVSSLGFSTTFKIKTGNALILVKKHRFLGLKDFKKTRKTSVIMCKGSLENEAELDLEKEIWEFMKSSKNPNDFPTKKELLEGGRIDLVNAVIKKGGWLSLGWNDDDDDKKFDDVRDIHTKNTSISQQTNDEFDQYASTSGRSIETLVEEDAGIEGILHRLERYRSSSFGINMRQNEHDTYASSSKVNGVDQDYVSADVGDSNYVRSRLQQMQLELSSSLCLLRSKSESTKPVGSELQQLSDTYEFQENEILNAKNKLRSIRAELAVLERKMSLSIIEAHKVIEAKQKIIDSGCRTLQVLITTCIIWPNSASDVRLAGSFDGWTTQRKMERSQTGVFFLSLKLYPGRYEIKFIVDGVWRVDPLRPIVNNDGHENNVLIIHE